MLGDAARVVAPTGESFAWMMTVVARRLEGRRIEICREPLIEARVAKIREVVPATAIPVPGVSDSIALWERAVFSVDSVAVGGGAVERVDVVATDIRIADSSAQLISVAHVDFLVTVNSDDLAYWMNELGVDAEFDMGTCTAEVRPATHARWLRVVVEPTLRGRRVEIRTAAAKIGRLTIPLPGGLIKVRSWELRELPDGVEMTGMHPVDGRHLEVRLKGRALELPVDIPRIITDVGVEGTMSVVRILRL